MTNEKFAQVIAILSVIVIIAGCTKISVESKVYPENSHVVRASIKASAFLYTMDEVEDILTNRIRKECNCSKSSDQTTRSLTGAEFLKEARKVIELFVHEYFYEGTCEKFCESMEN